MTTPRDLLEVIATMKTLTPTGDTLHRSLDRVERSVRYTAPEAMRERWWDLMRSLEGRFGDHPPREGWPRTLIEYFTTKSLDETHPIGDGHAG